MWVTSGHRESVDLVRSEPDSVLCEFYVPNVLQLLPVCLIFTEYSVVVLTRGNILISLFLAWHLAVFHNRQETVVLSVGRR